jgi:hypothetical protein
MAMPGKMLRANMKVLWLKPTYSALVGISQASRKGSGRIRTAKEFACKGALVRERSFGFSRYLRAPRTRVRDPGNVHSADGWNGVLKPVVARYQGKVSRIYFRADAAFAMPEVYEFLEACDPATGQPNPAA